MSQTLRHPLLGTQHGFATSLALAPPGVIRPIQVHGVDVVSAEGAGEPGEADAIVARQHPTIVGVVTADCVPVLLRADSGAVAAIHAGWRGLAEGVLEAGVAAIEHSAGSELRAVVGPCADACCYEVDTPVLTALARRYGDEVGSFAIPSRPGHARLDLGGLAGRALERAGVGRVGRLPDACTICNEGFESFRRDGEAAGRMLHWIQVEATVSQ